MASQEWLRELPEEPSSFSGLVRTYSKPFILKMDADTTTEDAKQKFITAGYGVGTTHPENSSAVFVGSRVTPRDGSKQLFDCVAEYATRVPERHRQDLTQLETPGSRLPTISYSFVPRSVFKERDRNNTWIENSASVPYDPLEMTITDVLAHVTWYKPTTDPGTVKAWAERFQLGGTGGILTIVNGVNGDNWHGLDPWQGLCTSIAATQVFEEGTVFWRIDAEIQMREDTWKTVLLDAGLMKRDGLDLTNITDSLDQPIREPVALDGAGQPLALSGTPQFNTFEMYRQVNFGEVLPNFDNFGEYSATDPT